MGYRRHTYACLNPVNPDTCALPKHAHVHTSSTSTDSQAVGLYIYLSLSLSLPFAHSFSVSVCAISVSALFHMIRLMIWALSGSCYSCLECWTAEKDARSSTCCGCNVLVIWNSKLNCRNARELWKTPEREGERDTEREGTYLSTFCCFQASCTSHLIRCLPLCFL